MNALHLIFGPGGTQDCLARAHADDTIVLMQDAVYAAVNEIPPTRQIHVTGDDARARGVSGMLGTNVRSIDYDDLVRLVEDHQPIVSWG